MYFVFDRWNNCMDFFDTEEEARKEAEANLDEYRDAASQDGWPDTDFSDQIGWGKVEEALALTDTKKRTDYTNEEWEDMGFGAWDEIVDYQLKKVE